MRVEQKHVFLVDMLRSTLAGQSAPADFQRSYVWNSADVEAMYRSLLRGWPIGSFVTWEPSDGVDPSAVSKTRLGPYAPEGRPTTILLDGQNRLATLAWTAVADGSVIDGGDWSVAERETWMNGSVLCAMYETKSVAFVPADEAFSETRLPMKAILQSFQGGRSHLDMIGKAVDRGAPDDAIRWYFDEVAGRIRESRVTTTNLYKAGVDEAREAFLHVCRTGQPMSEADFEAAVSWVPPTRPTPG